MSDEENAKVFADQFIKQTGDAELAAANKRAANHLEVEAERDAARAEVERLRGVIERDRTKAAEIISRARSTVASRSWLAEGRGSYTYDDETYQSEFGEAIREMLEALEPLKVLAADWSDCPKDFRSARVDWKSRAEALEAERDALRDQLAAEYNKGRASRDAVVAAGHALFVYAQKVTQKIKHHSLEKLIPSPDDELLAFIRAVDESSKSERSRIDAALKTHRFYHKRLS